MSFLRLTLPTVLISVLLLLAKCKESDRFSELTGAADDVAALTAASEEGDSDESNSEDLEEELDDVEMDDGKELSEKEYEREIQQCYKKRKGKRRHRRSRYERNKDAIEAASIRITRIEILTEDGFEEITDMEMELDLLDNVDEKISEILSDFRLPDRFSKVRLTVSEGDVKLKDREEQSLKVPSGKIKIKVRPEAEVNDRGEVELSFSPMCNFVITAHKRERKHASRKELKVLFLPMLFAR